MSKEYNIPAFGGIDQSRSENRLDPGSSPDACNMDTENGDLAVARGYVKHIPIAVPGTGPIRRLYIWRSLVTVRYIVIAGMQVYAWVDTDTTPSWKLIHTYAEESGRPAFSGLRWDFLECKIGNTDYLLIANGERQIIKWDGISASASLFGSEANGSNARVNFLAMHYSRLFACGDMDHPSRLYWSQPPGDERTIENWLSDEASENVGGGFVEVGETSGDPITGLCALSNQLLIFKRSSIFRLLGDRPSNYRVYRVHAEVEQMVDSGLILYGDTPFWMTNAGMYYHDGQTSQPMYNARQIRTILSGARLTMCKGAENRDRLYFSYREGGNNTNYLDNALIVYDVPNKTYMVRRGFTIADIFAYDGKMYLINDARYIYRFDEGDTYDGVPIHAYWNTPLTDLNAKPGIKSLDEMYFRATGAQDAILIDARIGKHVSNIRKLIPESEAEVVEIPLKNEGRVFSFKFSNEAGSRWTITGGVQIAYDLRPRTK